MAEYEMNMWCDLFALLTAINSYWAAIYSVELSK